MTDNRKRNRRILFAVLASIAAVAIVVPMGIGLWQVFANKNGGGSAASVTPTTSKAPDLTIKPLAVRTVVSAFVTTPEECPPATPAPPDQPTRVCDITRTAVYELGPEALRVQLTDVDSFLNPLTGVQTVQMSMTKDSADQFGKFTAGQVGKQVAFVRGGTVVWGPKISTPIEGTVLQLSGELTPEQAKDIARMIRNDA